MALVVVGGKWVRPQGSARNSPNVEAQVASTSVIIDARQSRKLLR